MLVKTGHTLVMSIVSLAVSVCIQGGAAGFNTGKGEKLSGRQAPILVATCLVVA